MLHKNIKFSIGMLIAGLYVFSFNNSIASAINGTWQSEGYSNIFHINGSEITIFDYTKVSCISVGTIPISEIYQVYDKIVFSDNAQEMTLYQTPIQGEYEYERINALPQRCQNGGTQDSTDAILNFDILWHTFNENYAFFDLQCVNWDAVYAIYRPQVSRTTSELELFNIFRAMLAPLQDGHTVVTSSDGQASFSTSETRVFNFFQRITDEYNRFNPNMSLGEYYLKQVKRFNTIIAENYLSGNMKSDASQVISWGKIKNRIGYLSVNKMFGFSATKNPRKNPQDYEKEDMQALTQTMELVMTDLQNMDAIVIDMRLNGGGFGAAAFKILSRFTADIQAAFISKAVSPEGFSDKVIMKMIPEGQYAFTKPVFVLLSENTASAAETFLLGMKVLPNVTLIGERSYGIFSDTLGRRLANSMSFTLSNEVITDMDGISYEKIGIQPDIPVNFLMKSDRDTGIDSAIEKVISLTP